MPELPGRKVGIVACSGEELAEGTVTRLAALKVLEQLRPRETVTICLPLFLAGGEGDRAFARFYPTIAVDGCEKRCAARATEQHSGKPAASVVVTDLLAEHGLDRPRGRAPPGRAPDGRRSRSPPSASRASSTSCSAGSGAGAAGPSWRPQRRQSPRALHRSGAPAGRASRCRPSTLTARRFPLAALPLIFEQFRGAGKAPGAEVTQELLETVKIYNDVAAGTDDAARGRAGPRVRLVLRPGARPAHEPHRHLPHDGDVDRRALGARSRWATARR